MSKKLLSVLLAVLMLFTTLPTAAWAAVVEYPSMETGYSAVEEEKQDSKQNEGTADVLSAPQNIAAEQQKGSLSISWDAPAQTYADGGALTYTISYATEGGEAMTVSDVQSPWTLYTYEPATKYTFKVCAVQDGVTGPVAAVTAWTPETEWDFEDWDTGWDSPYGSGENMVYPALNEQWVAVRTGVTGAVNKAEVSRFVPDTIQVWRGGTGNGQTWPQFIDEATKDNLADEDDNGYLITFFNPKTTAKGDTTLNFYPLSGTGTMSFKIRTNDMENTDFYIDLREGDTGSAKNKFLVRFEFIAKNTVRFTYNTDTGAESFGGKQTWTPVGDATAELIPEQWNTFEIAYDFEGEAPVLTASVTAEDGSRTELGTATLPAGAAINRLTVGGRGGIAPKADRNLLLDEFVRNTTPEIGTDTDPVNDVEITGVSVVGEQELLIGETMGLTAAVEPANAYNSSVTWSSSDNAVATVDQNGRVTGISEGSVRITATSQKTDAVAGYIDIAVVSVGSLPLNVGSAITIPAGELRRVKTVDGTEAVFTSDNPAVAAIENNGFITAEEPGTATITATAGDRVGTCVVTVVPAEYDDYDRMLRKYRDYLVPYEIPEDEDTEAIIADLNAQATELRNTMVKTYGDTKDSMLWESIKDDASNLHDVYGNLRTLAKAFYLPGEHYHDPALFDDIVDGMDWLLHYVFKGKINHAEAKAVAAELGDTEALESSLYNPGWWAHDIGMPWYSAEVLVLMKEAGFPQELLDAYCKRIHVFVPNSKVRSSGGANYEAANIADMCRPIMLQGLLSKDKDRVFQAARELLTSETVATTGSSKFNWDGTFVAHGQYSYELGYGSAFLTAIGDSMKVLAGETIDGEPMPLNEEYLNTLLEYVEKTFLPVIWRGAENPSVVGRGISRQGHALTYTRIYEVAYPLYYLLPAMPEEEQTVVKQTLKSWVLYNPNLLKSSNITMNQKLSELADDPSIEAKEPEGIFARNTGSRVYWRMEDFAFSVAMNNANAGIYPHEVGNGENLRGLHMGDGATYLFLENDPLQYMQNYFATFDFKHVPGITVEQRQETEEDYYTSYIPPASNTSTSLGNSAPWNRNKSKNSKHTLAGTAVLTDSEGQYGSTAFLMDLSGSNSTMDMDVTANKSWFMLGDKIIALGSNITSTKGREVDTSVDSRRLPVDGEHTLFWNGEDAGTFGEKTTTENSWAYIGYDVDGATAQVGYYFPNAGTQISFGGQDRTGSWYDNNRLSWYTGDSKEEITEPYADLFIHHGVNPVSGTYEYVILPNKTQEETAAYAAAKDYTVVALTDTLHVVYDHTLHVLAINNFADEAVSVTSPGSGVSYTVSRAAIVIIR